MKKLTVEEWILKAKLIHGNKYDYSKTKYVNSRTKVCIICPIHGEFYKLGNSHLQGLGCPKCSKENISKQLSLGSEIFIKRSKEIYGNEYDYSKVNYINNYTKVCLISKSLGELWIIPSLHLLGKLPKYKYNTKSFIIKASTLHNNKYDYSKTEYIDSKTKVCIICPEHGEFWQAPNNHLNGLGCPKCKYLHLNDRTRMTKELFIIKANKVHYFKYNYTAVLYINNKTKVIITCPKHGNFEQTPHDHLSGYGCPKCKASKGLYLLYKKLLYKFPNEEILYEVGNSVVKWLSNQRFDIYFPKYNIAIEYNGEQHYIPVKIFGGKVGFLQTLIRDELKRKKCKENNCNLFEIKYDYSEEDFTILINNINNIISNATKINKQN